MVGQRSNYQVPLLVLLSTISSGIIHSATYFSWQGNPQHTCLRGRPGWLGWKRDRGKGEQFNRLTEKNCLLTKQINPSQEGLLFRWAHKELQIGHYLHLGPCYIYKYFHSIVLLADSVYKSQCPCLICLTILSIFVFTNMFKSQNHHLHKISLRKSN